MTEHEYNHVEDFPFWKGRLDEVMDSDKHSYDDFCNQIIKEGTNDHQDYRKLCLYLAKSIGHINGDPDIKYNVDNINEVCAYLNYWLNNEIGKFETPITNAIEFYKKLKTSESHNPLNIDICETRITNMDDTVFTNVEFLHNLFFNLHEYRNNFRKGDSVICTYAKEISALYKEPKNECITENSSPFCKKLNEFIIEYNSTMSKTTCEGVPKKLQPFDEKPIPRQRSDERGDGASRSSIQDMQDEEKKEDRNNNVKLNNEYKQKK
ncbi:VIR protein [Plasmodium vivax]|uniref:VIR protein n=1 Tax=Plasmodium vivax TaxID=5855 RepID=A0A1G4EF61_PLAVI|nr:VIR protein [Plasmodium vivax]